MNEAVRIAIEAGDAGALRALVAANPALAAANVTWGEGGKNVVPPLHFVCDAVFRGLAAQDQALAMADALLNAGVDPNLAYARSGDTFLIAAASLGAESVGLRLVERGADVARRGLFGATALHWAALMGLERLARVLVAAGAELELADTRYESTPLQWALHGWTEAASDRRERIPHAARALVELGARVPAEVAGTLTGDSDAEMRAALSLGRRR